MSKRNGAKLRELSLNFPKLADWLYIGWLSCLAALGREFSNKGTFLLHDPVLYMCRIGNKAICLDRDTSSEVALFFGGWDDNDLISDKVLVHNGTTSTG